jgi:hypothetical protein
MPFWMLVLVLVTLIALCWGGGWGGYRATGQPYWGVLGILGLILFIVLVVIFIQGSSTVGVVR